MDLGSNTELYGHKESELGLFELPDEILLRILEKSYLSVDDIFSIATVCRRFHRICTTRMLWKRKFIDRWPWIWKQIRMKDHGIEDWKSTVCLIEAFHGRLRSFLPHLSEKLFHHQHIIDPVLTLIIELFPGGTSFLNNIYCYDELQRFIATVKHPIDIDKEVHPEENIESKPLFKEVFPGVLPRCDSLTEWYYARKLKQFIHIELCKGAWEDFLNLPPHQQCLERGAALIEKCVICNWDLTFDEVSCHLDNLAQECFNHIMNTWPNHPIASFSLRSSDEPLTETRWTAPESRQLFQAVNYVLYEKLKFEGNVNNYYFEANSFITQVLATKKGIPITLCIIYASICHRLGLLLEPVNLPGHFVMRWKVPGSEDDYEYIDAYGNGKLMSKNQLISCFNSTRHLDLTLTDGKCSNRKVFQRMLKNLLTVLRERTASGNHMEEAWLLTELQTLIAPEEDERHICFHLLLGFYQRLEINYSRIIEECKTPNFMQDNMVTRSRIIALFTQLLSEQMEPTLPIVPKCRSGTETKISFSIGMVMKHKLYHYICVIYGWDPVCAMPEEWILRMNVYSLNYSKNQPFYNVLAADGSNRYAAQENLIFTAPTMVSHPEVGKYFKSFNGAYYEANEQLQLRYPEEEEYFKSFAG